MAERTSSKACCCRDGCQQNARYDFACKDSDGGREWARMGGVRPERTAWEAWAQAMGVAGLQLLA